MAGESKQTTDHDQIQRWAEERGGVPSMVEGTRDGEGAGVLRIDFPGYGGDRLRKISWDEFFETFDEKELVFLYQDQTAGGDESRFFKLINK